MSLFERYLTLWVFLCIVVGVALGCAAPGLFQAIGALEVASVNRSKPWYEARGVRAAAPEPRS